MVEETMIDRQTDRITITKTVQRTASSCKNTKNIVKSSTQFSYMHVTLLNNNCTFSARKDLKLSRESLLTCSPF